MSQDIKDQTLALAGIYQAACLTQELARKGECNAHDLNVLVRSIMVTDAIDTASVFSGVDGLATGLRAVNRRLSNQDGVTDFEVARYVMTMTQLAGTLANNRQAVRELGENIRALSMNSVNNTLRSALTMATQDGNLRDDTNGDVSEDRDVPMDNSSDSSTDNGLGGKEMFAEIADVYVTTLSKLSPQVVVHGERGNLGEPEIVNKVRTALLGGVRAAWLWAQLGGRKWHLVFKKGAYTRAATELLQKVNSH